MKNPEQSSHRCLFLILGLLSLLGCENSKDLYEGKSSEQILLINRGKAIYQGTCTACHNSNPLLKGSLGPDIADSSQELLHSRVVLAKYPDGYKPKMEASTLMPAMPQFEKDIPALYEYLQTFVSKKL